MRVLGSVALIAVASLATACGSSGPPTLPPMPSTPPGTPVSGFVFYDEDRDGTLDPDETVRLPGPSVTIGGRTAQASAGGRFTVADVPAGVFQASLRADALPAYFRAGAAVAVSVPASMDVAVPVVLELGDRLHANTYMAFGDSITMGDGSSDGTGYRAVLQEALRSHLGKGTVLNEAFWGSRSDAGAGRIGASLAARRPAYALILYGTNDWNDSSCKYDPPCGVADNLRWMVRVVRDDFGSHAIVATLPPVNPLWLDAFAVERNSWVVVVNEAIRAMARSEQVPVAEVHREFLRGGEARLPSLFADKEHPNDEGYRLIADAFFDAVTQPYAPAGPAAHARWSAPGSLAFRQPRASAGAP